MLRFHIEKLKYCEYCKIVFAYTKTEDEDDSFCPECGRSSLADCDKTILLQGIGELIIYNS
jgi:RNA polymerase subunit RPABC4/transcription elongation factor Spt4